MGAVKEKYVNNVPYRQPLEPDIDDTDAFDDSLPIPENDEFMDEMSAEYERKAERRTQ